MISHVGAVSTKPRSSSAEHCRVASTGLTVGGDKKRKSHTYPAPGSFVYRRPSKCYSSLSKWPPTCIPEIHFVFFKTYCEAELCPLVSTHMSVVRRRLWLTLSGMRKGAQWRKPWVPARVGRTASRSFSSVSSFVKWGSSEYLPCGVILKIK